MSVWDNLRFEEEKDELGTHTLRGSVVFGSISVIDRGLRSGESISDQIERAKRRVRLELAHKLYGKIEHELRVLSRDLMPLLHCQPSPFLPRNVLDQLAKIIAMCKPPEQVLIAPGSEHEPESDC